MNLDAIVFRKLAPFYNQERRYLIPCFEDFYGAILKVANPLREVRSVLDLGAGTGLLTGLIRDKFPSAHFTLIDFAPEMLEVAQNAFRTQGGRFRFVADNYLTYDAYETYDLVVSSLSIHHLNHAQKAELYSRVYQMLKPGGQFVMADLILSELALQEEIAQKNWRDFIEQGPLTDQSKKEAFQRMLLDKPATLNQQFGFLKEAGFKSVEIHFKYFNFGVISGYKHE